MITPMAGTRKKTTAEELKGRKERRHYVDGLEENQQKPTSIFKTPVSEHFQVTGDRLG